MAVSSDSPADRQILVDRLGLTFTVLADPTRAIISAFGVQEKDAESALPALFVVDGSGVIRVAQVGEGIVERASAADIGRALAAAAKPTR